MSTELIICLPVPPTPITLIQNFDVIPEVIRFRQFFLLSLYASDHFTLDRSRGIYEKRSAPIGDEGKCILLRSWHSFVPIADSNYGT